MGASGSPLREPILAAHKQGLLNREIAAVVGCHHRTVAYWLGKAELKPNLLRGEPPERVDDEHSRCRNCSTVQHNNEFPFVRGFADGRRLSICRCCRAHNARKSLGASPESYFADRQNRLRNGERGARRSRQDIAYKLPDGYLAALWNYQAGQCFYTDVAMTMSLGNGRDPDGVSIDRVDPIRGYEVGNIVLCRSRVNTIKSDVTLGELQAWMPQWHERVVECLPTLVDAVVPQEDDTPRGATGRRLPSWVIERRARMERLTRAANGGGDERDPALEISA
ncbi:hypothetical protein [Lentzea cavernae]|uniref:HNH endonuclease n=1 Tax=Lentzea cavernae TaxID=2020703 RepID=A0ABQ3MSD1_9PSEU|nr:hypothetical protein [Lentzea cavernae]GHH57475.1 hypothetical protein GCM10017774_77020 [Lentzea cavernae]